MAVGIQERGKQLGGLSQPGSVGIDSGDEKELDPRRGEGRRDGREDGQQEQRSREEQEDEQPEREGVEPLRLGEGLRRELEQRGPADRHGDADAGRQRLDRIAPAQPETGIDSVEGTDFQFIDYLQSHDDRPVFFLEGPCQIPFGPVVDIGPGR